MRKPSWLLTIVTQIALCFALYLAFNLGQSHQGNEKKPRRNEVSRALEVYFISVRGGFRALKQRTLLLKQMKKVIEAYDVKFVVDIAELGEDDPLLKNGTSHFPLLRIPWYTLKYSEEKEAVYFLKQFALPSGKNLDIIAVNTTLSLNPSPLVIDDQVSLLTGMLEAADSHWSIAIGVHPLTACNVGKDRVEMKRIYEPLHRIFTKYQVNAYLSGDGCVDYARRGGVAYIRHPGPRRRGPFSMPKDNGSFEEMDDGFLVHRVSLLDLETYFVSLTGKVGQRIILHQRGAEAM